MKGYSVRDVAGMLGVTPAQVRAFTKIGFVSPERGAKGEFRFSFQDLVLLRTAVELTSAKIPARKLKRSLTKLRQQLPNGRPMTAVRISADGERVVVSDGETTWSPESGQVLFDFAVSELASKVAPLTRRNAAAAREEEDELDAEGWFQLGLDYEIASPRDARDAYRRAVELDPAHVDAHINLGRLLHEAEEYAPAEAHYRVALDYDNESSVAAFNLGVVLEDTDRAEEAIDAYLRAVAIDPSCADAHYNLAGIYEQLGRMTAAIRHLKAYRKLTAE